jgi:hypothetical protein
MLMHWLLFSGRGGAATGSGSSQCELGAKVLLALPICARLRLPSLPMRHMCRKEGIDDAPGAVALSGRD